MGGNLRVYSWWGQASKALMHLIPFDVPFFKYKVRYLSSFEEYMPGKSLVWFNLMAGLLLLLVAFVYV